MLVISRCVDYNPHPSGIEVAGFIMGVSDFAGSLSRRAHSRVTTFSTEVVLDHNVMGGKENQELPAKKRSIDSFNSANCSCSICLSLVTCESDQTEHMNSFSQFAIFTSCKIPCPGRHAKFQCLSSFSIGGCGPKPFHSQIISDGKSLDQITAEDRQSAKAVNFGLIYAMGEPRD